ncbi:MAG: DivIVA domain-containing protein [Actinobacteria bacterium]|nr:DivIVA domain-containing protein [Actinomycetota bacterium]
MPLTAAEVRVTKFSTTRMRSGYDMDEVDAFLDIVEADVAQYADELQRSRDGEAVLRTQCDQLQARLGLAEQRLADAQAELAELQAHRAHQTEPVPVPAVEPVPELSEADAEAIAADPEAASVLAIAQQQADEIVRHAQARANAVRGSVRSMLTEQMAIIDKA